MATTNNQYKVLPDFGLDYYNKNLKELKFFLEVVEDILKNKSHYTTDIVRNAITGKVVLKANIEKAEKHRESIIKSIPTRKKRVVKKAEEPTASYRIKKIDMLDVAYQGGTCSGK
jgi:phage-related protein